MPGYSMTARDTCRCQVHSEKEMQPFELNKEFYLPFRGEFTLYTVWFCPVLECDEYWVGPFENNPFYRVVSAWYGGKKFVKVDDVAVLALVKTGILNRKIKMHFAGESK